MKIKIEKEVKAKSGLLIFPIFKEFLKKSPYPKFATDFVAKRAPEFKAKKYDLLHTYLDQKALPAKMSIIGCGEGKKLSANIARRLGAKIGKEARSCRCEDATIFLAKEMADYVQELLEGILLVQYRVGKMKTTEDKRKYLKNINFIGNKPKTSTQQSKKPKSSLNQSPSSKI
ncbi:hypothetical protein JKY72_03660 [Candidatus Gracilibacteria bacterium]|nr:hypothetical protein [Candidatus Gracilibacteria bacterium]